jgi:AAA domain/Domain of unknown function (DUF3854)
VSPRLPEQGILERRKIPMALNSSDLSLFQSLGVTSELLARAGVRRVTDEEARKLLGASHPGNLAGIYFPYSDPETGHRVSGRLRRDHPEVGANGKVDRKYACAFGDNRHLYFPPGSGSLLSDPSVPATIVESEKAGLALTALAERLGKRPLVIGTGGCWGWCGKTGIESKPNGSREESRGPLPDFDRISWLRRKVVILFDSNVNSNPEVQFAREALGWQLTRRGAKVYLVNIPEGGGVNGPDDFIEAHGDNAFVKLLKTARHFRPSEAKHAGKPTGGFRFSSLGDLLGQPERPVEWVWGARLAAGTVSALVSKPKVGKSTFARNLCFAVARGEPFLGLSTKRGECFYIALEEREDDIRNDFRALGANGAEPILIHAAAAPADGIRVFCDLLRKRRPRLATIDPLFRLARVRDEKAYAETYTALGPLIDVARETGTHVMLLHHSGKGLKADPIDSPLGTTALGGLVSTLIVLKRTESYRVVQTVQRIGQDLRETVLAFDPTTRQLSVSGTRYEVERGDCETRILDFLKETGEPQTQAKIRVGVEGQTRIIRAALTTLVEAGRVDKSGKGTRGEPFVYGLSSFGSHIYGGTRKPESRKPVDGGENIGDIPVPENNRNPILVPVNSQPSKPVDSVPENNQDTLEI